MLHSKPDANHRPFSSLLPSNRAHGSRYIKCARHKHWCRVRKVTSSSPVTDHTKNLSLKCVINVANSTWHWFSKIFQFKVYDQFPVIDRDIISAFPVLTRDIKIEETLIKQRLWQVICGCSVPICLQKALSVIKSYCILTKMLKCLLTN